VGCLPGEKISRKGAEAQRGVFFFAALRLCEKKIISRKAAKGGYVVNAQISGISTHIFPQLLT
jgi:hypothetical protein